MTFSEWLIKENKVEIRDFSKLRFPRFWKFRTNANAIAVKGKYVYFRGLGGLSEQKKEQMLVHELLHIETQRKVGWFRYLVKYAFNRSFRIKDEIRAYVRSMEYLYMNGNDINPLPRLISGDLNANYRINDRQAKKAFQALLFAREDIIEGAITTVRDLKERYNEEQS